MSKVWVQASSQLRPKLGKFAKDVLGYVQNHPIPGGDSLALLLVPARLRSGRIAWKWPAGSQSVDQSVWQGMADQWLAERSKSLELGDWNGILIQVVQDSDIQGTGAGRMGGEKKTIKGEGLAEFQAVTPKFRLEDLIVPDSLREALLATVSIVEHTELIYEKWGFKNVEPIPRVVLNFFGPPGTGKTMAAHGVAQKLGKKIVIANFAEIESKYVGDSPKNLENIFRVAEAEEAVLFFDEADSFLGKRLTSVTSSSDQAVNSLRSKLLQLLEDFRGVVVFCTNLLRNYDKAFESRILRSLKFDLPDDACRRKLIRQKIPEQVPFAADEELDDRAIGELSSIAEGFSGREIKNAVLQTLCRAAMEGKVAFTVGDFASGFRSAAEEREKVMQERGALSKERADALSGVIRGRLEQGDYATSSPGREPRC